MYLKNLATYTRIEKKDKVIGIDYGCKSIFPKIVVIFEIKSVNKNNSEVFSFFLSDCEKVAIKTEEHFLSEGFEIYIVKVSQKIKNVVNTVILKF